MDNVDVNAKDSTSGWTPLLRAASVGGNKDVAELLIKFKAEIDVLDKDNKSALMIAVINGNQPLVQTLVEYGADLNIKNEYGKTAYEMAVAMERVVFDQTLVEIRIFNLKYICSCFKRVIKYLEEYFEKQKQQS